MAATQPARTGRDRLKAGGHRARAERTRNMYFMFVTLDVSKLSGWLNADAPLNIANIFPMLVTLDVSKLSGWLNADASAEFAFCRVESRAYDMRGEVLAGRLGGVGRRQRTSGMHWKRDRL